MPAFDKLKNVLPDSADRIFLGLSKPSHNVTVVYKAGALANYPAEAETYGLESFVLEKGNYLSSTIQNWASNIPAIGAAFQKLTEDERLDPEAFCIECYKGNDVLCMVKLKL